LRTLTAEYFNDAAVNEGYILLANEKPEVKEGERPMDVLSKTQVNYLRSDIKVFLNRHELEVSGSFFRTVQGQFTVPVRAYSN
jgi:hypothetical protein